MSGQEEEEVVEVEEEEEEQQQRHFEGALTVFEGSSPADVSHARQLWGSVSLLPPLESRLVSSDIRQRLPVARSSGSRRTSTTSGGPGATCPVEQGKDKGEEETEETERRRRCEAMAVRRGEILGLLRSQRELRLRREEVAAAAGRPGVRHRGGRPLKARGGAHDADREMVQQLQ